MLYTSVLLRKTSVAGVALSKAIQTCKNLQAAFARSHGFRHGSCLTRKRKALCTQFMCKGRMSRGTTFSYASFSHISGSFNGDRTGRLTVKVQPVGSKATFHTCFPTDSSQPVGNLSLAVPGYVLLFLTTFVLFRYSLYHSRGFFICQGGVSLTPPQKLPPALSSALQYRPRSRLFPAWSPRRRG